MKIRTKKKKRYQRAFLFGLAVLAENIKVCICLGLCAYMHIYVHICMCTFLVCLFIDFAAACVHSHGHSYTCNRYGQLVGLHYCICVCVCICIPARSVIRNSNVPGGASWQRIRIRAYIKYVISSLS